MKHYFLILFVLFVASPGFAQTEEKKDAVASTVDSSAKGAAAEPEKVDSIVKAAPAKSAKAERVDKSSIGSESQTETPSKPAHGQVSHADSVTRINDSLKHELRKFHILYTALKEKVVKHDFDPLRMSQIIDSLAMRRDSAFSGLSSSSAVLADSLFSARREIVLLKAKINNLTSDDTKRDKLLNELKELKGLLDSKILTQSEFEVLKRGVIDKWQ